MKKGFISLMLVMVISLVIAGLWDAIPLIKNTVNAVLTPTLGFLLSLNVSIGFILITLIVTLITTIIQKYGTDQVALKDLKDRQKILQWMVDSKLTDIDKLGHVMHLYYKNPEILDNAIKKKIAADKLLSL